MDFGGLEAGTWGLTDVGAPAVTPPMVWSLSSHLGQPLRRSKEEEEGGAHPFLLLLGEIISIPRR